MFVRLLLLMTVVPIVELIVLLQVHGLIVEWYGFRTGLLVTVGTIVATGILGASLARTQGLGVIQQLQRAMAEGRFPGRPLIDGAMVLAGGAMLLTPGFLTDLVGLSLLIPITRKIYRRALSLWLTRKIERSEAFVQFRAGPGADRGNRDAGPSRGRIIDVTPDDQERP